MQAIDLSVDDDHGRKKKRRKLWQQTNATGSDRTMPRGGRSPKRKKTLPEDKDKTTRKVHGGKGTVLYTVASCRSYFSDARRMGGVPTKKEEKGTNDKKHDAKIPRRLRRKNILVPLQ
jgi:hypothetical protein